MARVWILGSGLIGGGWAASFAAGGHDVTVIDPDPTAAPRLEVLWRDAFAAMRRMGRAVETPPLPALAVSPQQAGSAPDWVQESLPEKLDLKRSVFAGLEPFLRDDTIIASSSSGLSPDDMATALAVPGRLVIAHPCNPSHLMPVVELCGGSQTTALVMEQATVLFEGLGKTVLRMNKPMPGHLVNRLQAALWREAVHLASEGVASLGDIERAVTLGLAPRWTIIGPSTVFHVSGGEGGMERFLEALGPEFERWWATLGAPSLDAQTRKVLVEGMAEADPRPVHEIAAARDVALTGLMALLEAGAHRKSSSGGEEQ